MKYDFNKIINRENTNAKAIDIDPIENIEIKEGFNKIPMWVADMNFETAPSILEEINKRNSHPLFGYFTIPKEYYSSIIYWQEKRNNVKNLEEENIGYENGVLGGLSTVLRALASRGDNILVHSPTYVGFSRVLKNNGYNMILSNLYLDKDNIWRMDYEDMEKKITDNNIHLAIFCSPHNPSGRVWEREELEKCYELFRKHNVYVISDEIWSDFILFGNTHIPSQSINEDAKNRTISLYAPSKTFNLAGLVGSYHIIYNEYLKYKVEREASLTFYNNPNIFSVASLIGAYNEEGAQWVDELVLTLEKNINYGYNFIKGNWKDIEVSKPQGTYLLYLNLEKYLEKNNISLDEVLKNGASYGVMWQDGRGFNFDNTIRMNLALPFDLVVEAFDRLDRFVFNPGK